MARPYKPRKPYKRTNKHDIRYLKDSLRRYNGRELNLDQMRTIIGVFVVHCPAKQLRVVLDKLCKTMNVGY